MCPKLRPQERREHARFKPKTGAFAAIASDFEKVGQINDIGRGGLAFHYVPSEKLRPQESDKINIIYNGDNFVLKNILIKTVMDVESENIIFPRATIQRKMSVKFEDMSSIQETELGYFIQNYTKGEI